jgi:metallo-beta-lactamase family protein
VKLTFLGAATTVTGSQFLLETAQARILIDCGLFQGNPNDAMRNRLPLAYDPRQIDAILVTHAHLDHCGFLPVVVRAGYAGPIYATRGTAELARLVLLDSGKVQVEQSKRFARRQRHAQAAAAGAAPSSMPGTPTPTSAAPTSVSPAATTPAGGQATGESDAAEVGEDPETAVRTQPPHVVTALEQPLYNVDEAQKAIDRFKGIDYDQRLSVAPGISATFRDAGHILGSALIELDVEQEDGSTRRIVFSGDIGRPNTPILRDPTVPDSGADYVLMESTYGGREHEPEEEAVRMLAEAVTAIADHSGVLLIPSFAIGRTQEIVWHLDRLLTAGTIPHVPLYLDSPMAAHASDIYRAYPGYYDEETHKLLVEGETPLDYPDEVITNSPKESAKIAASPRPFMLVAGSGMLTGGRILGHLHEFIGDPSAMLLFVGYQGEGTLGAHLQQGVKQIHLDGQQMDVRCQIKSISGFSAHADQTELLDWIGGLAKSERRPRRVFLVHGDPDAEEALAPKVQALGLDVHRPAWKEVVELD